MNSSVCYNPNCGFKRNTLASTKTLKGAHQHNNWHIKFHFFAVIKSAFIEEETSITLTINLLLLPHWKPLENNHHKGWRHCSSVSSSRGWAMALLLLLSSLPRWETCLPSILPGSALEGRRGRIDCCTALCSEGFLSPFTPSQTSLSGEET